MRHKRMIFIITAIIIFLLGLIAHLQYFKTKRHIIELYSEKQITLALQASVNLEAFIKERIKAVEVLADMPASRRVEKNVFLTEYKRTFEKVKGFQFIMFIDQEGVSKEGYPNAFPCPSKQPPEIRKKFMDAFYQARKERKTVVFSKNVLVEGKIFICLISPIYSFENEFQGVILGVLNVRESLQEALRPIFKGRNDYAWILNAEGYLLFHPDHEDMLFHNIFQSNKTCFECHQKFSMEQEMLTSPSGVGIKTNLRSPKQLIGYAHVPLENTNWIVAVSSPFLGVTFSIRNLFMNFLLLVIFMMIAVIIGAILISRINAKKITAQKEIENLKAQSKLIQEKNAYESRYRILVEQSPDPIFLCTRKKLIMINQSFERIFGYKQDEVCNDEFLIINIVDPKYKEKYKKEIEVLIRGEKQISSITIGMRNKAGYLLEVEISLGRFIFDQQTVYQGIVHDITKIRQLEREREQKKHLANIGEMAARIAHEIKNPLASIQTGIQLLESDVADNNKLKTYYERLRDEIQRVDKILKGLLTYAREDYLELKKIKIEQVVKRFQELFQPTVRKEKIKLDVKIENNLPEIQVDEHKLEQVLWNLCLNSVQASNAGDSIHLNVSRHDGGISIKIQDHGVGIPNALLEKIFQPFFSTRTHGSGLGLAISNKIIEMHKGELTIESELNEGTTVTICLPGS